MNQTDLSVRCRWCKTNGARSKTTGVYLTESLCLRVEGLCLTCNEPVFYDYDFAELVQLLPRTTTEPVQVGP